MTNSGSRTRSILSTTCLVLKGHAYAEKFVGGTVYQAFLSRADYHRWHSPVKGTSPGRFPSSLVHTMPRCQTQARTQMTQSESQATLMVP
jgi:hypothetical protein